MALHDEQQSAYGSAVTAAILCSDQPGGSVLLGGYEFLHFKYEC